MSKTKTFLTAFLIAVIFVSSIAGTAIYYNSYYNCIVSDRDSKIASLNAQIANQTSEIANLTSQVSDFLAKVRITDFNVEGGWRSFGQADYSRSFNLTIENYGLTNVTGLVLKVKMLDDGTDVAKVWHTFSYIFDNGVYDNGTIKSPLRTGEIRFYSGTMTTDLSQIEFPGTNPVRSYEALVILKINNSTLDEKQIVAGPTF